MSGARPAFLDSVYIPGVVWEYIVACDETIAADAYLRRHGNGTGCRVEVIVTPALERFLDREASAPRSKLKTNLKTALIKTHRRVRVVLDQIEAANEAESDD
jgi:hypothetical protein